MVTSASTCSVLFWRLWEAFWVRPPLAFRRDDLGLNGQIEAASREDRHLTIDWNRYLTQNCLATGKVPLADLVTPGAASSHYSSVCGGLSRAFELVKQAGFSPHCMLLEIPGLARRTMLGNTTKQRVPSNVRFWRLPTTLNYQPPPDRTTLQVRSFQPKNSA